MSMVEMSFLVYLDRCIGCHACEIACKDENDLAPGVGRVKVKVVDVGEFNRSMYQSSLLIGGMQADAPSAHSFRLKVGDQLAWIIVLLTLSSSGDSRRSRNEPMQCRVKSSP